MDGSITQPFKGHNISLNKCPFDQAGGLALSLIYKNRSFESDVTNGIKFISAMC